MRTLLLIVVLGCGTAPPEAPTAPSSEAPLAPPSEAQPAEAQPAEAQPAEPSEPIGEPMEPADDSNGPVFSYAIDGNRVDEATFNALFERLDVDEEAHEGESVVRPDGSYGGAGQSFHARDGDVSYRYESHTHPRDDGRTGESRMLFRE